MQRRAKIIATLGPASADQRVMRLLLKAGADVVRLNLSHGSTDEHRELIRQVREIAGQLGAQVPVMLDLTGPRYRLGRLPDEGRRLRSRQRVKLAGDAEQADVPIGRPELLQYLKPGERVLIDNGLIELKIESQRGNHAVGRVVNGGTIRTRKGINLPDSELPFEISAKDSQDIQLAVEEEVDFLAASYVGCGDDLHALRRALGKVGGDLPLVAKLERRRAIEHMEEIVEAADAVMVARGDLGVEVPLHRVPVLQKQIIDAGSHFGKPVIVATQMLESMVQLPRPSRAEASDVANAVFDGADALLLSGETAVGAYPVQAVRTMVRIILEAESYAAGQPPGQRWSLLLEREPGAPETASRRGGFSKVADAAARAAVFTARYLGARHIVAFSRSGFTARLIARYRPPVPILVFTPDERVARQTQLLWGTRPISTPAVLDRREDIVELAQGELLSRGLVRAGERLILLMGEPVGDRPQTNLMRIHEVRG